MHKDGVRKEAHKDGGPMKHRKPNHDGFIEDVEEGLVDADRAADYIAQHIATADEMRSLVDCGVFTIQNMLHGRYYAQQEAKVHELMKAWNARLGYKFFNLF